MNVFIDRTKFFALPADLQEIVRQSAQASALRSIARANDRNAVALRELEARGTQVESLPTSVVQALQDATRIELDLARSNLQTREVIDSLLAYKARVAPYSLQSDAAVFKVR